VLLFFFRFGVYDVDLALNAGLDLEMPGIKKWRTLDYITRSIDARKLTVTTIKERVKKFLELVQKCAQGAPEASDIIENLKIELTLSRYWTVTVWKGRATVKRTGI
jgi:hypothetical protein